VFSHTSQSKKSPLLKFESEFFGLLGDQNYQIREQLVRIVQYSHSPTFDAERRPRGRDSGLAALLERGLPLRQAMVNLVFDLCYKMSEILFYGTGYRLKTIERQIRSNFLWPPSKYYTQHITRYV
jgi:hypothetical protein